MTMQPGPLQRQIRARTRGFTLIELLIVMVILAVLMAIAVPSMREFIARKRLEGIAQELATDLRYLRAQQIERGVRTARIRFMATDDLSCYVLYVWGSDGYDCDCTTGTIGSGCGTPGSAGASTQIKTVVVPSSTGVTLYSSVVEPGVTLPSSPNTLTLVGFNAMPYLDRTLQVSIRSTLGGEVRVSTNASAKPSLCTVSGSTSTIPQCT